MSKKLVLILGLVIFVAILLLDWWLWVGGWPTLSQTVLWAEGKCPLLYTQIVFFVGFLAGHWAPV